MATQVPESRSAVSSKEDFAGLGWHNGDYIEAIDNIIPMLAEDLACYADVCMVDRSLFLKDVMELIVLDTPVLSKGDEEYLRCVTSVRDWLLEDVEALARAFDIQFSEALVDVLRVIINDTPLADGFIAELAAFVAFEEEPRSGGAPC